MKGISPYISFVFLILLTVIIATIISGWMNDMSKEQVSGIANNVSQKLDCNYASIYVDSVTYVCNSTCFTGVPYQINASIKNTGTLPLYISRIATRLTDGTVYQITTDHDKLSTGQKTIFSWNSTSSGTCRNMTELEKVTITSETCPVTAYDSFDGSDVTFIGCS